MQYSHARGQASASRRAVKPSRRDDNRVPGDGADATPGLGDLDHADTADLSVLRMHAWQLLARGLTDELAGTSQVLEVIAYSRRK